MPIIIHVLLLTNWGKSDQLIVNMTIIMLVHVCVCVSEYSVGQGMTSYVCVSECVTSSIFTLKTVKVKLYGYQFAENIRVW